MKKNKYIILLASLVLVGCVGNNNIGEVQDIASTLKITNVPTISNTYEVTDTVFSPTEGVEPIMTSNPLMSSTSAEVDIQLQTKDIISLLNDIENCMLPCFLGIEPGITNWNDLIQLFSKLAYSIERIENAGYIYIQVDKDLNPPREFLKITVILNEEDIVRKIKATTGQVDHYSLTKILAYYGKPDEVRVGTWASGPADIFSIEYYLYYASSNTIIKYESIPTITDQVVQVCPLEDNAPFLIIWTTPSDATFLDIILPIEHREASDYPHLSEITDYDEDTFFETFRDVDSLECIDFSRDLFEIW